MDFKVGDKVKIVDIICVQDTFELDPKYLLNKTGVISQVGNDFEQYHYRILFDDKRIRTIVENSMDNLYWRNEELKLIVKSIKVKYKNWKGKIGIRTIIPQNVYFGHNEFHADEQWLMTVWDVDKDAERTYAMMDILEFIKE